MGTLVRSSQAATKKVCGSHSTGYVQLQVAVKRKSLVPVAVAVSSFRNPFLSIPSTGHMLSTMSVKGVAVTSHRLSHTDVSFPKYDASERSKAVADPTKPARDTEDSRRATAQGLLFGVSGAVYLYMATKLVQALVIYKSMPADQLAMANTEIDLNEIPEGQVDKVEKVGIVAGLVDRSGLFGSKIAPRGVRISEYLIPVWHQMSKFSVVRGVKSKTYTWRGKPLFVTHRTQDDIEKAKDVNINELRDPETDDARVKKDEWLITIGVCPHLGCVPLAGKGEYGGYYCPCHGSTFDTSGRIRFGPAPNNLEVPPYIITESNRLIVGD